MSYAMELLNALPRCDCIRCSGRGPSDPEWVEDGIEQLEDFANGELV